MPSDAYGIAHERLTYRHQGRYHRLTDVHGRVVRDILTQQFSQLTIVRLKTAIGLLPSF